MESNERFGKVRAFSESEILLGVFYNCEEFLCPKGMDTSSMGKLAAILYRREIIFCEFFDNGNTIRIFAEEICFKNLVKTGIIDEEMKYIFCPTTL